MSAEIEAEAKQSATDAGRGDVPNIEDRLRAAIALYEGLRIAGDTRAASLRTEIDAQIVALLQAVLKGEASFLTKARSATDNSAADLVASFLLSFASRAGTRDRLHLFTTNYDRFIEFGCDRAESASLHEACKLGTRSNQMPAGILRVAACQLECHPALILDGGSPGQTAPFGLLVV